LANVWVLLRLGVRLLASFLQQTNLEVATRLRLKHRRSNSSHRRSVVLVVLLVGRLI
jgi:hypothetical protein